MKLLTPLVHTSCRDLKPANALLKSTVTDSRGFIVKCGQLPLYSSCYRHTHLFAIRQSLLVGLQDCSRHIASQQVWPFMPSRLGPSHLNQSLVPTPGLICTFFLPILSFSCRLTDFGLARMLELNKSHVSTKSFGTIPYMPPELLSAGRMSRAADIFSFAIIM